MPERHFSIEKADNKQSNFANELKNFDSAREKVFHSFESRLLPINLDRIPTLK